MSRPESFASRLLSGNADIPPKAAWWPRHAHSMTEYLASPAKGAHLKLVRETVVGHAAQWDRWVPGAVAKGIMRKHAALEADLVDAAKAYDSRKVILIGESLLKNIIEQATAFGFSMESFPEGTFRRLMEEHVRIFVERVRLFADNLDMARAGITKRAEANALALAAFTVEWL